MSKKEIEQWLQNEFNNGIVLQGWIIAILGRKFSRIINYNQPSDIVVFELLERAISHGCLAKLEIGINNQI